MSRLPSSKLNPEPAPRMIRALPIEVVRAITAGETIDSLAAAVRELAENAIDAGATRITVALWAHRWDVCVTDNGTGMVPIELVQAARPHTTSKIHDREDLRQITTLGFRGEALYSLACLGRLTIASQALTREGLQVVFDRDGQPEDQQTIAIAPGTIVTVRDLFADLPGRREALPNLTRQRAWVRQAIEKIALCHPAVTWQVFWNDRPWWAIAAGETAAILAQFSPTVRREDLTECTELIPAIASDTDPQGLDRSIKLVLGLPDRCHRRRPDWIYLAVNGRMIHQPDLEQSILRATARTLPRGRYPVCFVHLQLPPDRLDWNRNPAKTEIYLRDLDQLQGQLETAIAHAYQFNDRLDAIAPDRAKTLLSVAEAAQPYIAQPPPTQSSPIETASSGQTTSTFPGNTPERSHSPLPNALRATSQVNQTYIVAEHDSGLWLIEQHIAHERVLYEQLHDRWRLVDLEPPAIVDGLRPHQVENLRAIGIETEAFGDTSWAVRQIPALLQDWYRSEPEDSPAASSGTPSGRTLPDRGVLDLADAIIELSQGDLEAAIVATACRSAIRNGTLLTLPQMQALLNDWQRTRNPHTCPHGRPIYLSLSESSLSRFFRRHWVIGKSHGI
jgi:DNA mismatch repair protein MutL